MVFVHTLQQDRFSTSFWETFLTNEISKERTPLVFYFVHSLDVERIHFNPPLATSATLFKFHKVFVGSFPWFVLNV